MSKNSKTREFKLIGGEANLDFVNTVAGRKIDPNAEKSRHYRNAFELEYLENYAGLVA